MTKLSEYRQTFYEFSGTTSDLARKLAFAGIGVIWVFRTGAGQDTQLPKALLLCCILFALTLMCDFLQYIAATVVWGTFQLLEEHKLTDPKDDPELDSPRWLKWPQLAFFVLKILLLLASYVILICYLLPKLEGPA